VGRIVLTRNEKGIIIFIIVAFLLGLAVKVYRDHNRHNQPPPTTRSSSMKSPLEEYSAQNA
jgi:hypothetical protein